MPTFFNIRTKPVAKEKAVRKLLLVGICAI